MRKGQVWVETVLYTLIGFTLIGVVLAFVMPKIDQAKDRTLVEQTISSLTTINDYVEEVLRAPGNIRIVDPLLVSRGALYINTTGDSIYYEINDLSSLYSENGSELSSGKVKYVSMGGADQSSIRIKISYDELNITYAGKDNSAVKKISAAATPYKLKIENQGQTGGGKTVISLEEISGR